MILSMSGTMKLFDAPEGRPIVSIVIGFRLTSAIVRPAEDKAGIAAVEAIRCCRAEMKLKRLAAIPALTVYASDRTYWTSTFRLRSRLVTFDVNSRIWS